MAIGQQNTTGRCISWRFAEDIDADGSIRMVRDWSCSRTRFHIVYRRRGARLKRLKLWAE